MSATVAPLQADHGGKGSRSHPGHKAKGEPSDRPWPGGKRDGGGKAYAGARKGKGKAHALAQKGKAHTIAQWAEEWDRAAEAAGAAELSSDRGVGAFLGAEPPLDLEGKFFCRDRSLVSVGMVLPLKIAKGLRHGLLSASKGGLKSVKFFELPGDAVKEEYARIYGKPMTHKIATTTALAAVVFNTQRETEEAVKEIHGEILRLRAEEVLPREPARDRQEHEHLSEENEDALGRQADQSAGDVAASTVLDDVRRIQRRFLLLLREKHFLQYGESQSLDAALSSPTSFRTADVERLVTEMRLQRRLHEAFQRFLEGLPLQREELEECSRRGLDEGGPPAADVRLLDNILLEPGLLIPARNVEGLITGLQWRRRSSPEGDPKGEGQASNGAADIPAGGSKMPATYKWVSRDKSVKGGAGGGSSMPFFCVYVRWSCRTHTVALVEGGLKAYAFAFLARRGRRRLLHALLLRLRALELQDAHRGARRGRPQGLRLRLPREAVAHLSGRYPVIGASGGQWHHCGEPLLHALARLSAENLLLFVDAGAVQNKLVLLDYFRSFRLLQVVWGLPTKFVWWGQTEKALAKDCDEQVLSLRSADPPVATCLGDEAGIGDASALATADGVDQKAGPWHTRHLSADEFWQHIPRDVQQSLQRIKAASAVLHDLRYWLNIERDCAVSPVQVSSEQGSDLVSSRTPELSDTWKERVLQDLLCSED